MRIGPPDLVLPGLVVGCLPIDGLRLSTLECFFSSDCIATIINYLDYYTQMDGSPPTDFVPPTEPRLVLASLNSSTPSCFSSSTPISTIMDKLFLEQWKNESSYESYFSACAPSVCQYRYVVRKDMFYVLTSLLSLYGGLTVSLRLVVWNGFRIYQKFKDWRHPNNRIVVLPVGTTNSAKEKTEKPNMRY